MRFARLAALATLAAPTVVSAQPTVAFVNAWVEVVAVPLTVDVVGATSFGSVFNYPHTEVIDPIAPTAQQSTAAVTIGTAPGINVLIYFSGPSVLGTPEGEYIDFYPWFAYSVTSPGAQGDQTATTLAEGTLTLQAAPSATGEDPTLLYMYLWMGGTITIAAGQVPGLYSGLVSIAVEVL